MQIRVEDAPRHRESVRRSAAERREYITIVLVACLLRRREGRHPARKRRERLRYVHPRGVGSARTELLHGDDRAAEDASAGDEPADRQRLSAASVLRDRVQGGRAEKLQRTQARPLRGIDKWIEERVRYPDRDATHCVVRRREKGELIAVGDREGLDGDELSGGRSREHYEARDENRVTRETGHVALEVALEGLNHGMGSGVTVISLLTPCTSTGTSSS